ncbi:MAG: GPR1/FUN34/YaaH family transporter [Nitrospirota bacterium]|nr:GPR1/FUN34/YaaH family transporter [Nitrospirota bacterium]
MTKEESLNRRIDVLAIGLFGLAVGALTLGMAQLKLIGEEDKVGVFVIAIIFGGVVQLLAGFTDIRYNEQLGGTALTMYGFYWLTVFGAELLSESTAFNFDGLLYVPIKLVYLIFSAVMVYLTAYRSVALSLLHLVITLTFLAAVCVGLGLISKTLPGLGHLAIGVLAFYHAIASLSQAFTGQALVPLGSPVLYRAPLRSAAGQAFDMPKGSLNPAQD